MPWGSIPAASTILKECNSLLFKGVALSCSAPTAWRYNLGLFGAQKFSYVLHYVRHGPNQVGHAKSEKENLAEYIMAGGFIFGGLNTEALEKYGGLTQVKDFWSERLSDTHPVYGAFFDLKGGMSFGYGPSQGQGKSGVKPWNFLRGHFVKGRLAGSTPGDGGWGWFNDNQGGDSTRQLRLAVNIIIYALTQGSSITQRLMPMVN